MELGEISLEDLLSAAIKAEMESRALYESMEKRARNHLIRERFRFLANEEKYHERYLRTIFETQCPGRKPVIPEILPVPLPVVKFDDSTPISEILEQAMAAEKAAHEFYLSLSERVSGDAMDGLIRLAEMEMSHYHILESELNVVKRSEDYDQYWELMHVGP